MRVWQTYLLVTHAKDEPEQVVLGAEEDDEWELADDEPSSPGIRTSESQKGRVQDEITAYLLGPKLGKL